MPVSYENITDTLTQYGTAWSELPPTPESQVFVVSEEELKRRKAIRIAFFSGIAILIGAIIYMKTKKIK